MENSKKKKPVRKTKRQRLYETFKELEKVVQMDEPDIMVCLPWCADKEKQRELGKAIKEVARIHEEMTGMKPVIELPISAK